MTDKLQLMLINVLLDQFLNINVSQGSVATRLRCDGNFNDRFITQSPLSPRVKKKLKIVQHCQSYWLFKYRVVFMKHGVYEHKSQELPGIP